MRRFNRSFVGCGVMCAVLALAACAVRQPRPEAKGSPSESVSTPATPVEWRAMTWNIRIGVGPETQLKGDAVRDNLAAIAARIAESGVDVALLQEIDRGSERTGRIDELETLAAATGFHAAWAPAIDNETMLYGIGILSRWPIASTDVVKLPSFDYTESHPDAPEWYSEQRVALVARIDHPLARISVIDTHLGITQEQRVVQVAELARLARLEVAAGRAVVVGGDFNAEPDGVELRPLRDLLRDAYHGHPDKNGFAADMPARARLTFPAVAPDRCIDYLFVSPTTVDVVDIAVDDAQLSDHRAVVATLRQVTAE